ncbi:hypothetical protein LIER_08465 [Lithospermum erythrorhizon]|uniref:Uncharacterized protein n=1 Tax=Lithospermum erythrorhizon TaxID=34254 RepID=A0AAV3PGE8_LITER
MERRKDDLAKMKSQLENCTIERNNLSCRSSLAESSAAVAVEVFKESSEYFELLKGNTTTLIRGFCQDISTDFPGIASHFKKYVIGLGEDFVVELFDDLPDDEEEGVEAEDVVDDDDPGSDQSEGNVVRTE